MKITRKLARRSVLKVGAAPVGALAMPAIVRAQQKEMVVAGYGGLYEEASKAAFYDPFTKMTGVRIKQVSPGYQQYAQLRLQVQNNNPEVDIFNLGSELMLRAAKEGLLAPIDTKIVKT